MIRRARRAAIYTRGFLWADRPVAHVFVTPELLVALATLITAIGAVIVGWRNSRKADEAALKSALAAAAAQTAKQAAEDSKTEIIATKNGVFEVGRQIDGRLTELLKLTESSAFAAGELAGKAARTAPDVG